MKTLLLLPCVAAAFISTAVAENLEPVQIHVPVGNPITVFRPVEKTTSVAVYAGKRSVASRDAAPRTVRWKSFRQDVPQGQTVTVFTAEK